MPEDEFSVLDFLKGTFKRCWCGIMFACLLCIQVRSHVPFLTALKNFVNFNNLLLFVKTIRALYKKVFPLYYPILFFQVCCNMGAVFWYNVDKTLCGYTYISHTSCCSFAWKNSPPDPTLSCGDRDESCLAPSQSSTEDIWKFPKKSSCSPSRLLHLWAHVKKSTIPNRWKLESQLFFSRQLNCLLPRHKE